MIKIHPYDAYLLLNKLTSIQLIKVGKAEGLPKGAFVLDGVEYEESLEVTPTEEARKAFACIR